MQEEAVGHSIAIAIGSGGDELLHHIRAHPHISSRGRDRHIQELLLRDKLLRRLDGPEAVEQALI
jgi:hypothetical protein